MPTRGSTLAIATDSDWLIEAFGQLARGDDVQFAHLLNAFEAPVLLQDSRTTVRTHFLASDANGNPSTTQLGNIMGNFLLDFAIPRSRIKQAWAAHEKTGSSDAIAALFAEAKNLLVKSDTSGEGGELLLFMLMERSLGYPQILSKLPHKTNSEVHVHGSDGVHARLSSDGVLDLYWGESKLYESSSKAFADCFKSIAPFLSADGHADRERDLLLIREHINVDDQELAAHLIRYFDETTPESLKVRWNGVCLIGFDVNNYPNLATAVEAEKQLISKQVARWHESVSKHVTDQNLVNVNIDVFCIPFPSVMELRKAVRARLGAY